MKLTDQEHEVMTNQWGNSVPANLEKIQTEQLLDMLVQVARAVGASIQDGDVDAMEVLEPLEQKLLEVMKNRI